MSAAVSLVIWTVICLCSGWSSMVEGLPFRACQMDRLVEGRGGFPECRHGNQKIYIGHGLPHEEVRSVAERRSIVQQCLPIHPMPSENEVPNIALIGSGGGERAMVALLATVLQLEEEGLLDCMMYLSGVSGSTWAMASLYKEKKWSRNVTTVIDGIFKRLAGDGVSWAARGEKLKKYYEADPENYSVTDYWSAFVVTGWVKEIDETYFSAQRGKHHSDPYPIFALIDKGMKEQKQQTNTTLRNTFVEITYPEVGYSLAGAFVDLENFGSKFYEGELTQSEQEMDMLYLQGLCGSALADVAAIVKFLWDSLRETVQHFVPHYGPKKPCKVCEVLLTLVEINHRDAEDQDYSDLTPKINTLLEGKLDKMGRPVFLDTTHMEKTVAKEELKRFTLSACDSLTDSYELETNDGEWLKIIGATAQSIVKWKWGTTYDFMHNMPADNGNLKDIDSAILESETRSYMDSGVALNSPYFAVLREERHVDLVISMDVSTGEPMKTVVDAHRMAKELGIPFPPVPQYPQYFMPEDIYVYRPEDPEDKTTPTVIHMPLFNRQNCGSQDNYEKMRKEFSLLQGAYDGPKIEKLKSLAAANVINTKAILLEEIQKAFQRKRS